MESLKETAETKEDEVVILESKPSNSKIADETKKQTSEDPNIDSKIIGNTALEVETF